MKRILKHLNFCKISHHEFAKSDQELLKQNKMFLVSGEKVPALSFSQKELMMKHTQFLNLANIFVYFKSFRPSFLK